MALAKALSRLGPVLLDLLDLSGDTVVAVLQEISRKTAWPTLWFWNLGEEAVSKGRASSWITVRVFSSHEEDAGHQILSFCQVLKVRRIEDSALWCRYINWKRRSAVMLESHGIGESISLKRCEMTGFKPLWSDEFRQSEPGPFRGGWQDQGTQWAGWKSWQWPCPHGEPWKTLSLARNDFQIFNFCKIGLGQVEFKCLPCNLRFLVRKGQLESCFAFPSSLAWDARKILAENRGDHAIRAFAERVWFSMMRPRFWMQKGTPGTLWRYFWTKTA